MLKVDSWPEAYFRHQVERCIPRKPTSDLTIQNQPSCPSINSLLLQSRGQSGV
jgi:hypothetical protein